MPTPSRSMAVRLMTAGCAGWPSGVKNHSTGAPRSLLATTVQPLCSRNCALGSARNDSSTPATVDWPIGAGSSSAASAAWLPKTQSAITIVRTFTPQFLFRLLDPEPDLDAAFPGLRIEALVVALEIGRLVRLHARLRQPAK